MSSRNVMLALGLGLAVCAGSAMARDRDDVRWSVTIGSHGGAQVYAALPHIVVQPRVVGPVYGAPVYGPPIYAPRHDHRYQYPTRWDRDGDGVPNRYDRRYNPAWDRDGDGIPNRYDRRYNPAWDRDGDGVPNRHDRHDDNRGHWRGR